MKMSDFSEDVVAELQKAIQPGRVSKDGKGFSHVEAWDIRRTMNKIFGFGNWSADTERMELTFEVESENPKKPGTMRWSVGYRAQVTVTVGGATYTEWAAGDAINPARGDAHDMAIKGLALDTAIPTPTGWTTMAEVKIGDFVFDMDGQPVRVTSTSAIKNLPCYRVTFRNGHSIVCDNEHVWVSRIAQEKMQVNDIARLYTAKSEGKSIVIPVAKPISLPDKSLPLDPWTLGYWLGNGSKSEARVTSNALDTDDVVAIIHSAGIVTGKRQKDSGASYTTGLLGQRKVLVEMGVLGHKHIPDDYMRGSISQRLALLRGLMDSDGTSDKRGRVSFCSIIPALRDQVVELARSLGEKVNSHDQSNKGFGKEVIARIAYWTPHTMPFALPRKAAKARVRSKTAWNSVASIEQIDSVPTRCVSVDSPTRTYLAGDFVPTHNTAESQAFKRCAVNLGDQFGLSLYNNGSFAATVGDVVGQEHADDGELETLIQAFKDVGTIGEVTELSELIKSYDLSDKVKDTLRLSFHGAKDRIAAQESV